jgi:hypothetical protein
MVKRLIAVPVGDIEIAVAWVALARTETTSGGVVIRLHEHSDDGRGRGKASRKVILSYDTRLRSVAETSAAASLSAAADEPMLADVPEGSPS